MNQRPSDTDAALRDQAVRGTIPANEGGSGEPAVPERTETVAEDRDTLLPRERMDDFRASWSDIQAGFVDDPRTAVQRAQELVGNVVNELTNVFNRERTDLEAQWTRGDQADTEAQRIALKRYRSFFNLLLG